MGLRLRPAALAKLPANQPQVSAVRMSRLGTIAPSLPRPQICDKTAVLGAWDSGQFVMQPQTGHWDVTLCLPCPCPSSPTRSTATARPWEGHLPTSIHGPSLGAWQGAELDSQRPCPTGCDQDMTETERQGERQRDRGWGIPSEETWGNSMPCR